MDKQIKKVIKDTKKAQSDHDPKKMKEHLKSAMKEEAKLLKMDKKFDKKLEKCDKMMKKK